jgi:hypothetical protein
MPPSEFIPERYSPLLQDFACSLSTDEGEASLTAPGLGLSAEVPLLATPVCAKALVSAAFLSRTVSVEKLPGEHPQMIPTNSTNTLTFI